MAGAQRKPDAALIEGLVREGHRYPFFAAVHLLHRLRDDAVPIGELGPVSREAMRFRHSPDLIFAAGDVAGIRVDEAGRPELTATFLGLYGAASPLAIHFSEDVIRAEAEDQPTLRAFYDLFHHRLLSLYYRAWKKYRLHAGFGQHTEDRATKRLLCMVGVDGHGGSTTSGLSRLEVLELAPLLAMRVRSPRVLSLALSRLLPGFRVRIEQFVERRAPIDREDRMRLGVSCTTLSQNATLGSHVRDRSARFRVILGPVDYATCESLMPGGARYPTLRKVIEHFSRGTLECEVDIELAEHESPGYALSSARGSTLGVNTRLGRGKSSRMRVLLTDDPSAARSSLVDVPANV